LLGFAIVGSRQETVAGQQAAVFLLLVCAHLNCFFKAHVKSSVP